MVLYGKRPGESWGDPTIDLGNNNFPSECVNAPNQLVTTRYKNTHMQCRPPRSIQTALSVWIGLNCCCLSDSQRLTRHYHGYSSRSRKPAHYQAPEGHALTSRATWTHTNPTQLSRAPVHKAHTNTNAPTHTHTHTHTCQQRQQWAVPGEAETH